MLQNILRKFSKLSKKLKFYNTTLKVKGVKGLEYGTLIFQGFQRPLNTNVSEGIERGRVKKEMKKKSYAKYQTLFSWIHYNLRNSCDNKESSV